MYHKYEICRWKTINVTYEICNLLQSSEKQCLDWHAANVFAQLNVTLSFIRAWLVMRRCWITIIIILLYLFIVPHTHVLLLARWVKKIWSMVLHLYTYTCIRALTLWTFISKFYSMLINNQCSICNTSSVVVRLCTFTMCICYRLSIICQRSSSTMSAIDYNTTCVHYYSID